MEENEKGAAPEVKIEIREVVPPELESMRSFVASNRVRELIGQRVKDTYDVDADKATESQLVQALVDEVVTLRPQAEDGRAYRESLIDEAMEAAGRAYGPDFAEKTERYRLMLAGESVESIRIFRDDWRSLGDEKFKGGRATEDEGERAPAPKAGKETPSHIYAAS
jgi:hypothetical protein